MTLAWPALFPLGRGYFEETRQHKLTWAQWATHLQKFHDGRFARHARFPYFLLNNAERYTANRYAGLYVSQKGARRTTLGELRALSNKDRAEIFRQVSAFSGESLRNTPEFFKERRRELFCMDEQLGDASAFCTNSHADTHCHHEDHPLRDTKDRYERACPPERRPASASELPVDDGCFWLPWRDDPFADDLSETEAYDRRCANLRRYPHVVAQFFHLKTQLFFEHIAEGALGADAFWCRYEWQSRGSTHAHYFLWLRGAPDLSFLDDWVQQELRARSPNGEMLSDEQMDDIVCRLNARALKAAQDPPMGGALFPTDCECCCHRSAPGHASRVECAECDCGTCPDGDTLATKIEAALVKEGGGGAAVPVAQAHAKGEVENAQCSRAAQWWQSMAERHSREWDAAAKQPNLGDGAHAASLPHTGLNECMQCDEDDASDQLPEAIIKDRAQVLNKCNRHTRCRASYCLRRDPKTGKQFCRFNFPQHVHADAKKNERAHFYCERVRKGIRWQGTTR